MDIALAGGWFSILPPLLAILLALLLRNVIIALFVGVWLGAWGIAGLNMSGLVTGLLDAFQVYVLNAVADNDHVAIMLFTFMIGGMVGIVSRNGGMQGIVKHIVGWARNARQGQLATAILGMVIFFDDYANTLVVGNTMRPVTDRLSISREKLAYIVDSTAAPIACIALVTTWVGYEVGLIDSALRQIGDFGMSAYEVFLGSILYSFYPILALYFVFLVALSGRDFGPMLSAEKRARKTGEVVAPDAKLDETAVNAKEFIFDPEKPQRAINAIIPVVVLVGGVIVGLFITGRDETHTTIRDIVGNADSYKALMWASMSSVVVAATLSWIQGILKFDQIVESWYAGVRSMMFAMIVLVLAWSLAGVSETLQTAEFLTSVLGQSLPVGLIPTIVFVLAALTAFATGSSWGTMGILMPLVIPLTWTIMQNAGQTDPAQYYVLFSTTSCVLAGAVWGDHCSPISDTTILSSMASGCDHVDHVRTQLPYAMLVGAVAVLLGTLPRGFGFPWWLSLGISAALLWLFLKFLGRRAG